MTIVLSMVGGRSTESAQTTTDLARKAMEIEADASRSASDRLDDNFRRAVEILLRHTGKVIVTGMGRSGHIGEQFAVTLSSTGSPAVFLHPSEAVHGDLGVYTPGDPTILISKSGATFELLRLLPLPREYRSPLIGILGNIKSTLAREVDILLDACVMREADPLNLAPTASTAVALALADALALAVMSGRNFNLQDFARFHPVGQLGRNLRLHVADLMHAMDKVACVRPEEML